MQFGRLSFFGKHFTFKKKKVKITDCNRLLVTMLPNEKNVDNLVKYFLSQTKLKGIENLQLTPVQRLFFPHHSFL